MIWLSTILLAIGLALLGGTSGIVISSIVAISEKRKLRKSVVSFLLVAFSTSLPEFFVAINSIIIGNMSVSLGDILGSNITNISLIVGTSLIVAAVTRSRKRKITIGEEEKKEFTTGLMILSITLLALLYLQYMSRLIGVFLLCVFLGYSYILFRKRREDVVSVSNETKGERIRKELVFITVGIAGTLIGARLTVESAIDIATYLGVPSSIIGATLVAFGTSLPELTVDVRAAHRGYLEITIGDIVGSCFLNSTLILGLLLAFTPFKVNLLVLSDLILFSVVSNLLLWYFLDNGKMGSREGLILLTFYLVNLLSILGILVLRVP
jgi:cation:H+ antiporter